MNDQPSTFYNPLPQQQGEKTMNDQPSTFYNPLPQQQSSPSSSYPRLYGSEPWQQPGIPFPIQQPPYVPPTGPVADLKAMTLPLQLQPSRLAPAGLILGIVSFIISLGIFVFSGVAPLVFFSWVFGFLLSTAGIVFSALSLKSISRKALAIIGLILSIITFLLLLLIIFLGILVSAAPH